MDAAAARRLRPVTTLLAAAAAVAALATAAGAAPAAVDLHLNVMIGRSATTASTVPNGSTQTVTSLRFGAGVDLNLVTTQSASAKVRLVLPDGLAWGSDAPDPTEGCTSTASVGECQSPVLEPIAGRNAVGWGWDVVAARAGSYVLRAEIFEASDTDPEPSKGKLLRGAVSFTAVGAKYTKRFSVRLR
jgi:hypothetical protein